MEAGSDSGKVLDLKVRKLGLIAGNGRFPFLVVEEALRRGIPMAVAAIREETFPEIEKYASSSRNSPVSLRWVGLGQLGRLIRFFQEEGVDKAIMAGQVRHVRIFGHRKEESRKWVQALPDWRMARLILSLPQKNTQSVIEAVIGVLEGEGIEFVDSTLFLADLLPEPGVLTRRAPDSGESRDIDFGWPVAREIARLDVGQTIVVRDQAVVAVEAMEGTDEAIRRAARLADGGRLTVIKVSRPQQDLRFDVPVIGLQTLDVLRECNASALAIDAGRTLILDRGQVIAGADRGGITIVAG